MLELSRCVGVSGSDTQGIVFRTPTRSCWNSEVLNTRSEDCFEYGSKPLEFRGTVFRGLASVLVEGLEAPDLDLL